MSETPKYTNLRDYLRVLRERRLLIAIIVIVFSALALAASLNEEPVYEARASISFKAENDDFGDIGAPQPVTETPEQRAAIQAERLTDLEVAERAKTKVKTDRTPAELLADTDAEAEARTNFVVVSARSSRAAEAAAIANAFAEAAVEIARDNARTRFRELARIIRRQNRLLPERPQNEYTRAANAERIARLENLAVFSEPAEIPKRATAPGSPVSPQPVRNTLVGAMLGLTIALVVAFMRDSLDRRFKAARDISDVLEFPLVGHVRKETLGKAGLMSNGGKGKGSLTNADLEGFRILRTNLDFLDVDRASSTVVVTSALPEEGKTTVAGALAFAYAATGRRALLVECDLRRPMLAKRLLLEPSPGLSDYLAGTAGPQEILQLVPRSAFMEGLASNGQQGDTKGSVAQPADAGALVCITAGSPSPRPAELLGSKRFHAFLEQVSAAYDAVVLDSSPLLPVVDTLELIPNVDRVVLCVRASKTTKDQARAAKAVLEHFPARPTGVVVTGVRAGNWGDYGYYGYAYGEDT